MSWLAGRPIRRTLSGSGGIGRTPSSDRGRPGWAARAPAFAPSRTRRPSRCCRSPTGRSSSIRSSTCARMASIGSCSPVATSPTRSGPTSARSSSTSSSRSRSAPAAPSRRPAREAGISEPFVACNGDVLTALDLSALVAFHGDRRARMTIALHPVDDPSRYGVVATDERRDHPAGIGGDDTVPARVVHRVKRDRHARPAVAVERDQRGQVESGEDVAVARDERLGDAGFASGIREGPAGAERLRLDDVLELRAEVGRIASGL